MRSALLCFAFLAACSSSSSSSNGSDASTDAPASAADGGRDGSSNTAPDGSVPDVFVPPGPPTTFTEVNAILGSKCSGCHQPSEGPLGDLDLSGGDIAHSSLVNKPAAGRDCASSGFTRVVPGSPGMSLLYLKLLPSPPCGDRMPDGDEPPLSQGEIDKISSWIAGGAKKD
jgi:hypothetical protein